MASNPPTTDPAAGPRWHRRKETRPTEILEAALDEFVSRGFAASRLDDIARRAGCTKGTIFLYFPTKEELFKAAVREFLVPRIQQAEQAVEQHEGPVRELLANVLRARWDGLIHSRLSGLPKLMFAEAANFPDLSRFYHDEVIARSQAVVKRILELGIQRGEFRDVDVHSVALLTVSPMLMASLWKHSFAHCAPTYADSQAYFDASLEILLRGIAREAQPGGQP
jgi:AcrR family transcriptional regulator